MLDLLHEKLQLKLVWFLKQAVSDDVMASTRTDQVFILLLFLGCVVVRRDGAKELGATKLERLLVSLALTESQSQTALKLGRD